MTTPNPPNKNIKYGRRHRDRRAAALRALVEGSPCPRCGRGMYRTQELHLDHTDDGSAYIGLSHAKCNLIIAGRKGNAVVRAKQNGAKADRNGCRQCHGELCTNGVFDPIIRGYIRCW